MKQLSLWGRKNPGLARSIIVFTHFVIGVGGAELGLWLYAQAVEIPVAAFYVLLVFFLAAYILYPHSKAIRPNTNVSNYIYRKRLDGILIGSLALLWVVAGNRLPARFLPTAATAGASLSAPVMVQSSISSVAPTAQKSLNFVAKSRHAIRKVQQWYGHRLEKLLKRYQGSADGTGGIVLLGVLITMLLVFLTIVLACNLACAGNDTAAIFMAILGAGLIALTWVLLAKWIRRVRKPKGVW